MFVLELELHFTLDAGFSIKTQMESSLASIYKTLLPLPSMEVSFTVLAVVYHESVDIKTKGRAGKSELFIPLGFL